MIPHVRMCYTCKEIKVLQLFRKHHQSKFGYRNECQKCDNKKHELDKVRYATTYKAFQEARKEIAFTVVMRMLREDQEKLLAFARLYPLQWKQIMKEEKEKIDIAESLVRERLSTRAKQNNAVKNITNNRSKNAA